jgi:hypothetical protein
MRSVSFPQVSSWAQGNVILCQTSFKIPFGLLNRLQSFDMLKDFGQLDETHHKLVLFILKQNLARVDLAELVRQSFPSPVNLIGRHDCSSKAKHVRWHILPRQ